MKASELRELSIEELKEKVSSFEEEQFNLRFQAKLGQLSNPVRMRLLRRDTARAMTVLQEKKREAASAGKIKE